MGLWSEIRDPEKTYSGWSRIRVQGSKRHWVPDPDPQHCLPVCFSWRFSCRNLAVIIEWNRPQDHNYDRTMPILFFLSGLHKRRLRRWTRRCWRRGSPASWSSATSKQYRPCVFCLWPFWFLLGPLSPSPPLSSAETAIIITPFPLSLSLSFRQCCVSGSVGPYVLRGFRIRHYLDGSVSRSFY